MATGTIPAPGTKYGPCIETSNPNRGGKAMTKPITCYGVAPAYPYRQEWYGTASRDAGRRARQLRKLGYHVLVSPQGEQMTKVGRIKLTLLTIMGVDGQLPEPDRMETI